jgi:hypothetical protein
VGGDPDQEFQRVHAVRARLLPSDRLVARANAGRTQHETMRVLYAVGMSTPDLFPSDAPPLASARHVASVPGMRQLFGNFLREVRAA